MIRYIRSNQTNELNESAENANVKDVWYKYFDGTANSVDHICEILGISRGELAEAYIPNGVTTIGGWAFRDCYLLTKIIIPDSVTEIRYRAFIDCSSLESITIPNSVTSISMDVFYNTAYYNNESNWENGILYIGKHLIEAKNDISGNVEINQGTKTIADDAFYNCTSLTSITIPDSVTIIGSDAFRNCDSLKSITIPDGVTSIGDLAFKDCPSLVIETNNPYVVDYCAVNNINYKDIM